MNAPLNGYLDTCIVSGIAKRDIGPVEIEAIELLQLAAGVGQIQLVTSSIVSEELEKLPPDIRRQHQRVYELIASVERIQERWTDSSLTLLGAGGGSRTDPLLIELRDLLPDENDARHLFQAIKNQVSCFVTVDHKTILRFQKELQERYSIRALSPAQFADWAAVTNPRG